MLHYINCERGSWLEFEFCLGFLALMEECAYMDNLLESCNFLIIKSFTYSHSIWQANVSFGLRYSCIKA